MEYIFHNKKKKQIEIIVHTSTIRTFLGEFVPGKIAGAETKEGRRGEAVASILGDAVTESTAEVRAVAKELASGKEAERGEEGAKVDGGVNARLQGTVRESEEPFPFSDCSKTVPCSSFANFLHIYNVSKGFLHL
jgi:hypothetical protein